MKKDISSKITAEKIKDTIVKEIVSINNGNPGDALKRPNMAIVVIETSDNTSDFIDELEKEAVRVGVDTHTYKCPIDSDEEEIGAMIDCLNDDDLIDGIYIQTPIPKKFNSESLMSKIKSDKELNLLIEHETDSVVKQAKLFKGVLDIYKERKTEVL
jgi:methylenetetrahydrofolate dehydrogenase (NADP+) / methenyltetrahydrofolate cyclohydrolase